ncbi:serine hydrolase [Phycicoccus sp. Soil748]|uniref:serine hydrolase domain-containing protein n=1 Tax=Phycicoccus sp. Soil748 TaxID=1736397 RepID=UPI000702A089|nr:serine hydrolase [Phycicoccus sp. Soil748]KRE56939.1 hypothetical protein ASG70_00350 [Phycicoccus sp. Soil748]
MRSWGRAGAVVGLSWLLMACSPGHGAGSVTGTPTTSTAATGAVWSQLPTSALPADRITKLQHEINRWVATGLLKGVTAAVATPQGVWGGAAGVDARGVALVPGSGLALGSITKTFTAAEVMLLAERGKIDLDRSASAYIDLPQVSNGVTVRQLLAQRSGVAASVDAPLGDRDARWTTQKYLKYVPAAKDPPGKTFADDNTNYILLGLIIEKASGRTLADAFKTDLWGPLGLDRLAYQDAHSLPPPLAAAAPDPAASSDIKSCATAGPWLPCRALATVVGAAGAVAGDAEAVAHWGYDLYGSRVLRKKSVEQMTDFPDDAPYGLGTIDFSAGYFARWNIDAVGHIGSMLGYQTVMAVFRDAHVSVAILTPSGTEPLPYVQYLVKAGGLTQP